MRLTQVNYARYFKRYVDREIRSSLGMYDFWKPIMGWRVKNRRRKYQYTEDRPWTDAAKQAQKDYIAPRFIPAIEPIKTWKIFKGDRVEVQVGKDKGKQGLIMRIIKEKNWCFVEGLNCEYEIVQRTATDPGMCIRVEKPLSVTDDVKLVDPSDNKVTDIVWRYSEDGKKIRISVRTGRAIPMPDIGTETDDFVVPSQYKATDKDTKLKDVTKVTYKPKLMTFESDIMEQMGIKEDRKPKKTYWY